MQWTGADLSAMAAMPSFAARLSHDKSMTLHMSAKLPPIIVDGRVSWFHYAEAVDEWLSITSIDKAERYGPLLTTPVTGGRRWT